MFNLSVGHKNEFRGSLFLLCLRKLSLKCLGIKVVVENGKICPQPQVSLVCPISESQTMSIREHPTAKFCTKLFISSVGLLLLRNQQLMHLALLSL